MNEREHLIALSIIYEGDWHKILDALVKKVTIDEAIAYDFLKHIKCKVMTLFDEDYPEYLRSSYQPPFVLYYYGDISLIYDQTKNISVVGGRKASLQGLKNVDYIVSELAKDFNIVSGLAIGVDTAAHKAALFSGGKTIAVLGNGIEYCYPSCNSDLYDIIKNNHLVISEYYNYFSPSPEHFPQRNRLIVAFSRAVIFGESHLRSGTSITLKYASDSQKDIMSIPSGELIDSLNNQIITEGCPAILNAQDVKDCLSKIDKSLLYEVK